VEAKPRLLNRVVGLRRRAEHAVGHRAKVGAMPLELGRLHVFAVHRHILSVASVMGKTKHDRSM
jgi:hypothetical protein